MLLLLVSVGRRGHSDGAAVRRGEERLPGRHTTAGEDNKAVAQPGGGEGSAVLTHPDEDAVPLL